ncbi:phospho-sugar mutase [Lachnoclostridium sp. MSJ-17]|uniref:phospho-sugar mutase n=1 Tax=Lachnoclostridium sp. MSJ-17 TaxID=2841516 RepID=UPI001C11EB2A|nr:phospho-sugar mutase [Lachnoclostridium sp. MSJ-17]MBU5461106.1 phospho-sugar mutase [Lachnoclostridium sp. MSJ-17]
MDYKKEYLRWCVQAKGDADVENELSAISSDESKIEDAFYRDLAFGTGGLRGVIGAGTNRMNIHTVAKASQGLSDYLIKNYPENERKIAVSYDSRIKSDLFSRVAAGVFAANGIKVYIYTELMPTPCLSYAVRALNCAAGIMVTASHNPSKYNGYKVYGADGCQITTEAAKNILSEIEKLDIFADVKTGSFDDGIKSGSIEYISDDIYTAFVEEVKNQSVLSENDNIDKNVAIVFSPLNGTGLKPVLRTLSESGYTNITVVKEQEQPDGNFTTCPYPNPEIKEAMSLGMEYAEKYNADLLLATDPDCDRVGIAVKTPKGDYRLMTGNETGMLLLDYICKKRIENGTMPEDPVFIKTIVTIDMAERIAADYGVRTVNVLTGFKFIGEQIGFLEQQGKENSYIFGMEESYGYLSGGYVRDKDAVDGAFLICEMFAYYKTKGISLLDKLEEQYKKYGYCLNTLHSFEFEGSAGFAKMQKIMKAFRGDISSIGGKKVVKVLDYAPGLDGLPKSDVLKFLLEDNCSVVVRPSGTEPKLKTYLSVSAGSMDEAEKAEKKICEDLNRYFQ